MLKYHTLWMIAFAMLFLDMGTTAYMIQDERFEEGNDKVVEMMDNYGDLAGLGLSVILRAGALTIMMGIQKFLQDNAKFIPILILFPLASAPAIHNIVLYVTGSGFL